MTKSIKNKIPSRITDWPKNERPRERLMRNGVTRISPEEKKLILKAKGDLSFADWLVKMAKEVLGK